MADPGGTPFHLPLSEPELGEEEVAAVAEVIRGGWLTLGPRTAAFEREFAAQLNCRHAIAVSSATAALHLANIALDVGPGDEVLCPSLTFVASANASLYTGSEVVFADICGRDDLTVSPEDLAAKITPRTKAITVVHYAGFSCHMEAILELAQQHSLRVIEDCAHAPLAGYRRRDGQVAMLGTLGDIGCFSFYGNKNMTTGEGGMVVTNDDRLAERVRLLRSHGMTSLSFQRHQRHASGYDVVALGYNYRIDELRAAIGQVQLGRLTAANRRRRQVFAWYRQALAASRWLRIPFSERDLSLSACHILPLVVDGDEAALKARMAAAGIQTSKHYEPVNQFDLYKHSRGATPIVAGCRLITLPLFPAMTKEQVEQVVAVATEPC